MSDSAVAHVRPRQRYAWRGLSLLVTDERGECGEGDQLSGYYYREARHLSALRLEVNGAAPWLCADGSAGQDGLDFVYVYPELTQFGGGGTDVSDDTTLRDGHGVTQRAVDLRLRYHARLDSLDAELVLTNRSRERVELELAWIVDADFADVQEAHAGGREQCAEVRAEHEGASLWFLYLHPALPLQTRVTVAGGGTWVAGDGRRLVGRLALRPRQTECVALRVEPVDPQHRVGPADAERRLAHLARWRERLTRAEIPGARDVEALLSQAADNYCAAKHAIKAFTDSLRMELEEEGAPVSVTLVKPGSIDTPFFQKARLYIDREPQPVPPVYAPELVATTILECAERPVRDILVSGMAKVISLAGTVAPRLTDYYMERSTTDSQKTDVPVAPDRRDNLYEPMPDDGGERGRYRGRVAEHSLYTRAALHPREAALATAIAGVALVAGWRALRGDGGAAAAGASRHVPGDAAASLPGPSGGEASADPRA